MGEGPGGGVLPFGPGDSLTLCDTMGKPSSLVLEWWQKAGWSRKESMSMSRKGMRPEEIDSRFPVEPVQQRWQGGGRVWEMSEEGSSDGGSGMHYVFDVSGPRCLLTSPRKTAETLQGSERVSAAVGKVCVRSSWESRTTPNDDGVGAEGLRRSFEL